MLWWGIGMQKVNVPNVDMSDSGFWSESWVRHIENYLSAPPRCGIWLRTRFELKTFSVLELAGGSCRDSRYLHGLGVDSKGSDFDAMTLSYIRQRFPESSFEIMKENAFSLSFPDKSLDFTFHNGFWICFNPEDVNRLLVEQTRVTRKTIVAFMHNIENRALVADFAERGKTDPLYQIRFFHRNELKGVVEKSEISYKAIRIEKFGGIADMGYSLEKRFPALKSLVRFLVPKLYQLQPWSRVERIALIIELA